MRRYITVDTKMIGKVETMLDDHTGIRVVDVTDNNVSSGRFPDGKIVVETGERSLTGGYSDGVRFVPNRIAYEKKTIYQVNNNLFKFESDVVLHLIGEGFSLEEAANYAESLTFLTKRF